MKAFESAGIWFLPDDPDNQLPGTLAFSETDGFKLTLTGSFQNNWNLESANYPVLRGAISDSPFGKFVTLFDCFATGIRFGMPRVTTEDIKANYGFAGSAFVDGRKMKFDGATITISSLMIWLNYTGLKGDFTDDGIACTWNAPEEVNFQADGATITIAYDCSMTGFPLGGRLTLEAIPRFKVHEFGGATAEDIHSRFLSPLLTLMSFASDGNANLERYSLNKAAEGNGNVNTFDRLYVPAVTPDRSGKKSAGHAF